MQDLNVSLIQTDLIWENPEANRKALKHKIEKISDPTDLIILPEVFNTGFPVDPEKFAELIDGPTVKWMRNLAFQKQCVITGSLLITKKGKYYNCLIWMRPDGSFETYNKRHVFHLGEEADTIEQGSQQLIVELKGWKIKPLICYDLRFPIWSKNTYSNGAFAFDLLLYVANWPSSRRHPWKQLLIARAIENLSYSIGVNRIGRDNLGLEYTGDSLLIDPKGIILSDFPEGKEKTKTFVLSKKELCVFRDKFNVGFDWDTFELK